MRLGLYPQAPSAAQLALTAPQPAPSLIAALSPVWLMLGGGVLGIFAIYNMRPGNGRSAALIGSGLAFGTGIAITSLGT